MESRRELIVCLAWRERIKDNTELGEFQDLQGQSGLLVSGSTALSFFNHCSYGGDLDTYCQFESSPIVGKWVRTLQWDTLQAVALPVDSDIREYKLNNIAAVWNYNTAHRNHRSAVGNYIVVSF
ncbi:hypothetical protein F5879DRAFT_927562 [Lentinula edodes]|nr:hypothetical protein F5879DRAFT_927562 [Lentinula edodes]